MSLSSGYNFHDNVDLNQSSDTINILAGNYSGLVLRFSGTQSGATPPTEADFGSIRFQYNGKQHMLWNLSELGIYNNYKYGARESVASVNDTDPFSYQYFLPFVHHTDFFSSFKIENDQIAKLLWLPGASLASRVSASSFMRVLGVRRDGPTSYLLGSNRIDSQMAMGNSRPEPITPYSTNEIFLEYNTNIDNIQIDVDGDPVITGMEIIELTNEGFRKNRVETYPTLTGQYAMATIADVDLTQPDTLIPTLNNQISVKLLGSSAATISMFWTYFEYKAGLMAKSTANYRRNVDEEIAKKAQQSGVPISVISALKEVNKRGL